MLVGNRVRQARMQDSQKRGSYLGKSGPKPKGVVLFGKRELSLLYPMELQTPETHSSYGPVR